MQSMTKTPEEIPKSSINIQLPAERMGQLVLALSNLGIPGLTFTVGTGQNCTEAVTEALRPEKPQKQRTAIREEVDDVAEPNKARQHQYHQRRGNSVRPGANRQHTPTMLPKRQLTEITIDVVTQQGVVYLLARSPSGTHMRLAERGKESAEVQALLLGMEVAQEHVAQEIVILTDCDYLITGFNSHIHRWSRQHWEDSQGRPIRNAATWEQVQLQRQRLTSKGMKVRAEFAEEKQIERVKTEFRSGDYLAMD